MRNKKEIEKKLHVTWVCERVPLPDLVSGTEVASVVVALSAKNRNRISQEFEAKIK